MERKTYMPVFSGRTIEDSQRIVVYKETDNESQLHISFPDLGLSQDLWALSPGHRLYMRFELDTHMFHIRIEDPFWTGEAKGSRADLIEEPAL